MSKTCLLHLVMFLLQQLQGNVVERLQTKQRHYIPICFLIILLNADTFASGEVIITHRLWRSYFLCTECIYQNHWLLYLIHKNTVRETDDRVLLYWAQMNTTIWQSEKKTGAKLITCLSILVLYWLYSLWLYVNGFWKTQGNALPHTCPVICCEYCHVNCIFKIQQSQAPNWDLSIF